MENNLLSARRRFSAVGFALVTFFGVTFLLQMVISIVLTLLFPDWAETSWAVLLASVLPQYAVALPLCLLVFRAIPAEAPQAVSLPAKKLLIFLPVSIFLMYAGNFAGLGVTGLLQLITGRSSANPVMTLLDLDSPLLVALLTVIVAPLVEELVFRKLIIDRLRRFGGALAIVFSAAMFGLFHGNLSQLFYAFALGLLLGYVYLRTGRLIWSILLHAFINFLGSVLAPMVLNLSEQVAEGADITAAMQNGELMPMLVYGLRSLLIMGYSSLLICCFVIGLALFFIHIKKLRFAPAEEPLEKGRRFSAAFVNPGVMAFFLLCLTSIVLSFFA